jgi:hypothetical protein
VSPKGRKSDNSATVRRESFPTVSRGQLAAPAQFTKLLFLLVGARGFEPPTPSLPD